MNTEAIFSQDGITAVSSQIQQLKTLFPACFDRDGRFLIDKFQAEMAQQTDISREFYAMNWLGKSYARLLRNLPPETLLSEDKTHNAKPENAGSQNLLIRGDNLEVLKHLKNAYTGSVKMIYIDPPYNTGSDGFVYQDDRKFTPAELARLANIDEDEAARILDFTDKGSNSHSAWLTFMYPRLYIARELLKDDGVIFISIDDNEAAQLKLLCDEVFGEGNFVGQMVWHNSSRNSEQIAIEHEYIFCYATDKEKLGIWKNSRPEATELIEAVRGVKENGETLDIAQKLLSAKIKEYKEIDKKNKTKDYAWIGNYNNLDDDWNIYYAVDLTGEGNGPARHFGDRLINPPTGRHWMGQDYIDELFSQNRIVWRADRAYRKLYIQESESNLKGIVNFPTRNGGEIIKKLFSKAVFEKSKPINLISHLAKYITGGSDLILDFFAGSGTTAHAVMQLNAEEQNGSRRYICVQLPEKTDEKSEAHKAGYPTIFDITKARIEKAAAKIRAEYPDYTGDLGFKIFQTVEHFRQHQDNDFSPDQMDFPFNDKLSEEQLQMLLTTWTLYDGAALTTPVEPVRLGDYTAYLCEKRLYLINEGFTSADLLAFIKKLDNDADFNPNRVIVFGSNMASAMQHELDQAVRGYTNKKEIELNVIIRV